MSAISLKQTLNIATQWQKIPDCSLQTVATAPPKSAYPSQYIDQLVILQRANANRGEARKRQGRNACQPNPGVVSPVIPGTAASV
jgi:hypothetical protein